MLSSHHTPRNGDYAAHIDQLVNQGARAPGQTATSDRPKSWRWQKKITFEKTLTSADTDAPASLAEASGRRRSGLIRYLIAAFLLMHAVRAFFTALHYDDDFVPAGMLAVIAVFLIRSARLSRRRGRQAPKPLPPLTTLSKSN